MVIRVIFSLTKTREKERREEEGKDKRERESKENVEKEKLKKWVEWVGMRKRWLDWKNDRTQKPRRETRNESDPAGHKGELFHCSSLVAAQYSQA